MLGDIKPFRMIGNIYYVGTRKGTCHMIDTGEGLLLIDTGYVETGDVIVESIETLGFDPKTVRWILLSHGHYDHVGSVKQLVALSGAKVYLHEADMQYLRPELNADFTPDVLLHGGETLRFGSVEVFCLASPGHTDGTLSFFFDVTENGKTYRAAMFGGSGTNQLKKTYFRKKKNNVLSYLQRGRFFETTRRLRQERVDVVLGNHVWQNRMMEKYEKSLASAENPFIDPDEWGKYMDQVDAKLEEVIRTESRTEFVNYAHRGASEYYPENMLLSFSAGISMGANGIETDVRPTKDGVLILFHDKTPERLFGVREVSIADMTYDELLALSAEKNGHADRILTFEQFLQLFGWRDLQFAIELKASGIAAEVAALLHKYDMRMKTTVTSFSLDNLREMKACAPEFRCGWLCKEVTDETEQTMLELGLEEICPRASQVTAERVQAWHRKGFNVRAWGVDSDETMKNVYDSLADGMTVNFPDRLDAYIREKAE